MDQLIGIIATIVSAGVLLEREGVPGLGISLGYLFFGLLFVTLGLFIGNMIDTSIINLLLLKEWNINISLMVIGYATIITGLAGCWVMIRDAFKAKQKKPNNGL